MSTSKHTAGPWYVEELYELRGYQPVIPIEDTDGNEIAQAIFWSTVAEEGGQDESRANARLIAAAPELLEALEALVATFVVEQDDWDNDHLWYLCNECDARVVDDPDLIEHESNCRVGLARAVIKKARGE